MLNKKLALLLTGVMLTSMFAGCTKNNTSVNSTAANNSSKAADDLSNVDVEVWNANVGFLPVDKGSPLYNLYKEKIGVGVIQPYVEWNGGSTYQQQLNLRIASGDMPDIFIPINGMESQLIQNGSVLDLTKLLPEKAPKLWNLIPQSTWEVQKTYDSTGKNGIYTIPDVLDYAREAAMIRKDWLDKLGLKMPTTQDELVNVLKAFRDNDPNGNGQKDEIPTSGRQEGTWMDELFAMYGIPEIDGKPDWDVYDGKLTYSAVTPNMKDALAFLHNLYTEGLLDKETFLNDKAKWTGKIDGNKVGLYYHWAESTHEHLENLNKAFNIKPDFQVLPAISAPGYKGFYTKKTMLSTQWVVKNQKDQKKIDACMKVLNAYGDKSLWEDFYYGVKDMEHTVDSTGKRMRIADDKTKQQNLALIPYSDMSSLDFNKKLYKNGASPERQWVVDQDVRNMDEAQKYAKTIGGDGMPASVYDGYPDILNRTLYIEYMTKIILGDYPVSKFDEFVDKWNKSGGDAVTKNARAWYDKVNKQK